MIAALAGTGASAAIAQPATDPTILEDRAYQDFTAGRLDEALRGYQDVYAIAPRPDLLFAIGNLQQQLGQCERAIETLEAYLASGATAGADKARTLIDGCRATVPVAEPVMVAPIVEPARPRPQRGAGRRRVAYIAGGVGLVAVGGTIAAELAGRDHLDHYRAGGVEDEFESANRYHYLAQGLGVVGGACLVTATYLWITGRPDDDAAPVAVAPARGGAVVTWSGGF